MKFSLILVAMHVLNALLVVSSANTSNSSKNLTKEQTYSNHHNNMDMLATPLNKLISYYISYVRMSKTLKCAQYSQSYKLAILSFVGIFNEGSMVLENEIIRFPPSTLLTNCEKIAHIKMTAMIIKIKRKKYIHTKKKIVFIQKKYVHKKKFVNKKGVQRMDCIYDGFDLNKNFKKTKQHFITNGEVGVWQVDVDNDDFNTLPDRLQLLAHAFE
ncbi:hypothetical protein RFI_36443 [Reticulomyxa filosa]|uniref:Uncharacterized protein n=1 Tax=Reticulomyxa filosa TaxID=46433 RepID=X6LIM8_RETFI|nr:hypothetical protein RFI_36443 [Reticulomyxa filosa]|eukprot:ETO00997.1 hypothetical protein RFI_36443 [Reticulomyxa filosa]